MNWRRFHETEEGVIRCRRADYYRIGGTDRVYALLRRLALVPKYGLCPSFYHGLVGKGIGFCGVISHLCHFGRGEHFNFQKVGCIVSISQRYASYVWALIVLFLSGIMGLSASDSWITFLQFIHQSQFSVADPIFSKNVGFYVFRLPLYNFLLQWCSVALFLVIVAVGFSYYLDQAIEVQGNRFYVDSKAKVHLVVLGGLFALRMVWSYRLKLYGLMYSNSGVAYGASYSDVHAQMPAYWVLLILSFLMAILLFAMPVLKRWRWVVYGVGIYGVVFIGFSWIYPGIIQQYVVKPK